jgi:hypothetical protein
MFHSAVLVLLAFASAGSAAEPARIELEVSVIKLPAGAAADLELSDPAILLSAREAKLLQAVFQRERAAGKWSEPLCPAITVRDGQLAVMKAGDESKGLSVDVTPMLKADGSVELRIVPQVHQTIDGKFTADKAETSILVQPETTAVVRTKSPWGEKHELLVRVTAKIAK